MSLLLNFVAIVLLTAPAFVAGIDLRPTRNQSVVRLKQGYVNVIMIIGAIMTVAVGMMRVDGFWPIAALGLGIGLGPLLRLLGNRPGCYLRVIFIPYLAGLVFLIASFFV